MIQLFRRGATKLGLLVLLLLPSIASAHVVVMPAEVGAGAFQTFVTGVPNEKDTPTTVLRLVMPDGLQFVTPNVKPGWNIEVKKDGEGDNAKVTELIWTGGEIPAGQRDEFSFSAKVPGPDTILNWKAYQTYKSGDIVSWDETPSDEAAEGATPYSQTNVVNDLTTNSGKTSLPLTLSIIALIVAIYALITRPAANKK